MPPGDARESASEPTFDLPASLRGDGRLVSVVVPTYGDAAYLPRALESVADQTHGNVEVVLVDSTGVDALSALADRTDGVRYVFQEPQGLAAARNRGIDAATGEVVAFLDADDWWAAAKLERQLAVLEQGADVVYSDAYVVEGEDRRYLTSLPITDPAAHHLAFLREGGVPIPTVVVRRSCLEAERFDERLPAVEDRNLLVRLFREYTPGRVPAPLAFYNRRESSMSSDAEAMYAAEMQSLDALCDRYDEVARHREALAAKARYKFGKRLVRTGDPAAARRELVGTLADGHVDARTLALLAVALLPAGNRRALERLERLQERFR